MVFNILTFAINPTMYDTAFKYISIKYSNESAKG